MDRQNALRQSLRNTLETALLLGGMALSTAAVGWVLLGAAGFWWTLVGVLLLARWGSRTSPARVLRAAGARELDPHTAPHLWAAVRHLAQRAGLESMPRLFLVPSAVPNAAAMGTGQDAVLVVTPALLQTMGRREMVGILAHEVAHIRNGDLSLLSLGQALAGVAHLFGTWVLLLALMGMLLAFAGFSPLPLLLLAVAVLLPRAMSLLFLALSRSRELAADLGAAELTGDPEGLALALWRLERMTRRPRFPGWWSAPEATPGLWRTHPPTEERVRRLLALAPRRWSPVEALVQGA